MQLSLLPEPEIKRVTDEQMQAAYEAYHILLSKLRCKKVPAPAHAIGWEKSAFIRYNHLWYVELVQERLLFAVKVNCPTMDLGFVYPAREDSLAAILRDLEAVAFYADPQPQNNGEQTEN